MRKACWERNLFELIRKTSTDLPADVEAALRKALRQEKKGSHGAWMLETILQNVAAARRNDAPLCQDTGVLTFYFRVPAGFDTNMLVARTCAAVSRATRHGYLRQNTIDALSGSPYPTNVAHESPVFHFQQGARKTVDVRLIMKGGGSENVGRQYKLPDADLDADRDLAGVRKCVLDALWRAQGSGCAPGVAAVCIGGDRAGSYAYAKEQFLRKTGEKSPVRQLARLEERLMKDSRRLGVGPMGMGGKSSLLGVKVGALSRLPACYFVTVSYMCWALRRRGAQLGPEGGIHRWTY